jgi:lysophospholipase L1-like esterase
MPDSVWDFNALVEKSFIPDMIQITKKAGIQLILVREKNAKLMTIQEESPAMRKYFQELADFLKERGVPLLDFSHDPSITIDMFHDEMHLLPQGQTVFTRLVAESLLSLLK